MKERGKAVETFTDYADFCYSSSEMPCRKHPSSSPVGICAYCLKDRLVNLVCSDCGEQRLSSCSCSDISSSYRNSCSAADGTVGRISFLIENERGSNIKKGQRPRTEEVILFRRSTSSCVEFKRDKGFWKIGKIFRKKRAKGQEFCEKNDDCLVGVSVSRSRSMCSFRGGGFITDLDESSDCGAFSSAKISDVTGGFYSESEPRRSGFSEGNPRKSGFSEGNPRKSGYRGLMELERVNSVPNRSVFPVKESDFSAMDESAFIDLKLDLLSPESRAEIAAAKMGAEPPSDHGDHRIGREGLDGGDSLKYGRVRRGSRGHKVWKWILRHQPGWKGLTKKDEISILKS